MYLFTGKFEQGKFVPLLELQKKRFEKLVKTYEEQGINIELTIQISQKNINTSQEKLYRAFVLNASEHFGNTYEEMELLLKRFYPKDFDNNEIPLSKWKTQQLDNFINQANSYLSEYGFKFD